MTCKKKKIVVIGSSNTDLVIKTGRIPSPGETIIGGDFMMTAGGKGANQAVAVSRLGGDVLFVARVGNDVFGNQSLENYNSVGLNTSRIIKDSAAPSGVALICVDQKGENSIVVASGANNRLSKTDIDAARADIMSAEYILMQLEIPMDIVEYVADMTVDTNIRVILNPAPAAELSPSLISKLYLITPNRTECQTLTGIEISDWHGADQAASRLIEMGARNVIVTLGNMGALVVAGGSSQIVPAHKVEAVDTTAAGDVFNGALCVALSEGKGLVEAAEFASFASSISVTRMGAQSSVPNREELDVLIASQA